MIKTKPAKRSIFGFSLILLLSVTFLFPAPALARGINFDDTVEEGEVLEQNLFLSGPAVVMDGVVHGDLLAFGDEVTINGEVDGSLIAGGKKVILNGPVTGNAVISALTLVVGPQASIGRDVYFVGASLATEDSSQISRDLNVVSLESVLNGSVDRDVNALVGPLQLLQVIRDYMESRGWLPETGFVEDPGWGLKGKLQILQISQESFKQQAPLGLVFGLPVLNNLPLISTNPAFETTPSAGPDYRPPFQGSTIDVQRLKEWAVPLLRNLAALLILGLLVIWLVPAQLSSAAEQVRRQPWRVLLTGLFVFTFGWVIALLVFVLIIVLALFLYWISLPALGFLVGTMGLTALGLAVSVFWLAIVYLSKLVVAALIGSFLLYKVFKLTRLQSRIWPLVTGVVLYGVLASIPYLGWLVAVLSTLFGLGALWFVSLQRELPADKAVSELAPAGENLDMSLVSEE